MQERLPGGIALVAIGFSPPEALHALADHLGLQGPVLADVDRRVYALMGLPRAPLWRVYSPGTLARYARAALLGRKVSAPVEDTRQLGGDGIAVDGVLVRSWRPNTPDDRVRPEALVAAARAAAEAAGGGNGEQPG